MEFLRGTNTTEYIVHYSIALTLYDKCTFYILHLSYVYLLIHVLYKQQTSCSTVDTRSAYGFSTFSLTHITRDVKQSLTTYMPYVS